MADYFAGLGRSLDSLLGSLGVHNVNGLDAGITILGAAIFLGFCAAVPSAVRITLLRRSASR